MLNHKKPRILSIANIIFALAMLVLFQCCGYTQDSYSALKKHFQEIENVSAISVRSHFQEHVTFNDGIGVFGFADANMQWAKRDDKYYVGLRGHVSKKNDPRLMRHEIVYNGKVYFRVMAQKLHETNEEFTEVYVYSNPDGIAVTYERYWQYLGILIPGTTQKVIESNLHLPKDEFYALAMLKRFKKNYKELPSEIIDGLPCNVLSFEGRDKWYLDRATSLPVRRVYYWPGSENAKCFEIDFKEYVEINSKLSLPKRIVAKTYGNVLYEPKKKNVELQLLDIRVDEFLSGDQVPDSLFERIDLPIGTQVYDTRDKSAFRLENNDEALIERLSNYDSSSEIGKPIRNFWRYVPWFFLILGLVVGTIGVFVFWKRGKR